MNDNLKVKLFKSYYVKNCDLRISADILGHEVFVVKINKSGDRVKVKTITSIEGSSKEGEKRKFKITKKDLVELIYNGEIIVIPKRYLNTPKLSGVYTKGIWIHKSKLLPSKYNTKFPKEYIDIIGK